MTFFSAKTRPPFAHEGTGFVGFGVGTGAGAGAGAACDLGGLRTNLATAEGGAGSTNETLRESSADGVAAEATRGDGAEETDERASRSKRLALTRAVGKSTEIEAELNFLRWGVWEWRRRRYRQPDCQTWNCFFDRSERQVCKLEQRPPDVLIQSRVPGQIAIS